MEPDDRDTFRSCPLSILSSSAKSELQWLFLQEQCRPPCIPLVVLSMLDAAFVCRERPGNLLVLFACWQLHTPLMVRLVTSHSSSNNGQSLQSAGTMLVQPHFTDGETEHTLKPRAEPVHCSPGLHTSINKGPFVIMLPWGLTQMGKTKQCFSF